MSTAIVPRAVADISGQLAGLDGLDLDGSGRLGERLRAGPVNFSFQYKGFLFAGRTETAQEGTRLRLHAHLGNLPYSAESGYARANAAAIVAAASRKLGGRVVVSPSQRIFLIDEREFDQPLTPVLLVTTTTRLVLEAKPYLELLAVVVKPPAPGRRAVG